MHTIRSPWMCLTFRTLMETDTVFCSARAAALWVVCSAHGLACSQLALCGWLKEHRPRDALAKRHEHEHAAMPADLQRGEDTLDVHQRPAELATPPLRKQFEAPTCSQNVADCCGHDGTRNLCSSGGWKVDVRAVLPRSWMDVRWRDDSAPTGAWS